MKIIAGVMMAAFTVLLMAFFKTNVTDVPAYLFCIGMILAFGFMFLGGCIKEKK